LTASRWPPQAGVLLRARRVLCGFTAEIECRSGAYVCGELHCNQSSPKGGTSLRVTLREPFFATQDERFRGDTPPSGCQTRALCVTHPPHKARLLVLRGYTSGPPL